MFQVPHPQSTAATPSPVLRPLSGLLCLFFVLVVGPALADETSPASVAAPGRAEAAVYELDSSVIQATANRLEALTSERVDRIVRDRTQRMMERLYRLNDEKMRTANRLAGGMNPRHRKSTTQSPAKALAMAEEPQPEEP